MRLAADLLVIDLEATEDHEEIIDIGAVLLDRRDLSVLGEFQSLVKPERSLTPFITELTGIDDEMLASAEPFPVVAERFLAWANEGRPIKRIRLCAWGTYFDIPLLRRVYARHGFRYPFPGTAYDAKTLAFLWAGLSGRRTDRLDVAKVARGMGIRVPEKMHRGIVDARATAGIVQRVFRDLRSGLFLETPKGVLRVEVGSGELRAT